MLQHILPADIGNDGEHRMGVHDVGEVLIRSDSQIGTSGLYSLVQVADNMEIRRFVRNEIIRIKVALRLRSFIDVLPELQSSDLNVGGCARLFVVPGNCAGGNNECCQESGKKNGISAQLRNGHHG